MFRKSRKSSTAATATSVPQSPRFFEYKSQADVTEGGASFSLGVKPKSPGLLSRLFKRSKDELVVAEVEPSASQIKRKSLWQRSKSVLRPRAQLDRSESAILDLPKTQLNIYGSGSAAQLLLNEIPIEEFYATKSVVDTDGLLQMIFESNLVMYEQLKSSERARRIGVTSVYSEGIISPVLSSTILESVCQEIQCVDINAVHEQFHDAFLQQDEEDILQFQHQEEATLQSQHQKEVILQQTEEPALQCHQPHNQEIAVQTRNIQEEFQNSVLSLKKLEDMVLSQSNCNIVYEPLMHNNHHFEDNPKLDSPLHPDSSESFNDSDQFSMSFRSSVHSFNNGECDLARVDNLSLDKIAELFDCLKVTDREVLNDGTVRCLVDKDEEVSGGSQESIRFFDWKQSERKCQSEEKLKMTEISIASEPVKTNMKMRSMSVSAANIKEQTAVPFERRRSLGARVSQIVALFEGSFK